MRGRLAATLCAAAMMVTLTACNANENDGGPKNPVSDKINQTTTYRRTTVRQNNLTKSYLQDGRYRANSDGSVLPGRSNLGKDLETGMDRIWKNTRRTVTDAGRDTRQTVNDMGRNITNGTRAVTGK